MKPNCGSHSNWGEDGLGNVYLAHDNKNQLTRGSVVNANQNLFSQFRYDSWAPQELLLLFPTLEDAVSQLDTSPNLEAAFAVFWKILEKPDPDDTLNLSGGTLELLLQTDPETAKIFATEGGRAYIQRLRTQDGEEIGLIENLFSHLVMKLKPVIPPDGNVQDVDAWIFATVSAAAAIELERADSAQTERLWELVESALAILERPGIGPWCSPNDYLVISNCMVASWLWMKLFRLSSTRSDEKALECLYRACLQCEDADDILDYMSEEEGRHVFAVGDWLAMRTGEKLIRTRGGERLEPGPGMLTVGAGYHLVTYLVPAQEAVDSFERLSPDTTD